MFPYPPNFGGRVDVMYRLEFLKSNGYNVDLVVATNENSKKDYIEIVKKYTHNLWVLPRVMNILFMLHPDPFQIISRLLLKNIYFSNEYDIVIMEGDYVFMALFNRTLSYKKLYVRVHNNECLYFRELANSTKNPLKYLYYSLESLKMKRIKPYLYEKADKLLFISNKEYLDHIKLYPEHAAKSLWLPPLVKHKSCREPRLGKSVIFVGSLYSPDNRSAITWYLEKVHPLVTSNDYSLIIAGNTKGTSLEWLYSICRAYDNVSIYDSPVELDSLYDSSRIFISPILNGAGLKMKSIEAILNGLALISTEIGVEGSGLVPNEHFLLANDPVDFANAVDKLIKNEEMRLYLIQKSQEFIRTNYDGSILIELLNEI
ncbi:glycosyltransferase family 4 protein [Thermosynechococcus sp. FA-CM-4201]